MSKQTAKLLNRYIKEHDIVKPTMLLKHYDTVHGIELSTEEALKEIVKGRIVVGPLTRVTGYGWVDSDLNIYHKDDPTTMVTVENQIPSLRVRVRRGASRAFFGDVLSEYRIKELNRPSILSLIPLTHAYYKGDILLKPGATNIHYHPVGSNIELPVYFKDGVLFSKHTVRKQTLERKSYTIQYQNKKYELTFRDIMYQVLNFPYYEKVVLYRYDNTKPFTVDNCIMQLFVPTDKCTSYDKDLMVGR